MIPTSRRADGNLSFFTSKSSRFFKIILEDTIRAGKLGIPREFVTKYGSSLPKIWFIRVPSGAVWQVELSKHEDDAWFHNGWQEFAECCSLDYGHLIVFEHQGSNLFNVLIFDKSAAEINYPYYSKVCREGPKPDGRRKEDVVERNEDDGFVELLDVNIRHRATGQSPLTYARSCKKRRIDSTSRTMKSDSHLRQDAFQHTELKTDTSHSSMQKFGGLRFPESEFVERTPSLTLTPQKKREAFQRASAFRSKNPYFMVAMQPSYVSGRELVIPKQFAWKYFKENPSHVILCVSDGRVWSAQYRHYRIQSNPTLYGQWPKFVLDNNIKVGDVCVFELIKISEFRLKVSIFRAD